MLLSFKLSYAEDDAFILAPYTISSFLLTKAMYSCTYANVNVSNKMQKYSNPVLDWKRNNVTLEPKSKFIGIEEEEAEEPVAAPVVPVRRVVRKVHTYHYGMSKVFMCSTGVRSCTLKVHTSATCQTLRGRASTTTVIPLDMCRLCGGENVRTEEEDLDGQEQIRIGHAIELQVEDR